MVTSEPIRTVTNRYPKPVNELVDAVALAVVLAAVHGAPFKAGLRTRYRGRSGPEQSFT